MILFDFLITEVVYFILLPLSVVSVFQGHEDSIKNDGTLTVVLN